MLPLQNCGVLETRKPVVNSPGAGSEITQAVCAGPQLCLAIRRPRFGHSHPSGALQDAGRASGEETGSVTSSLGAYGARAATRDEVQSTRLQYTLHLFMPASIAE